MTATSSDQGRSLAMPAPGNQGQCSADIKNHSPLEMHRNGGEVGFVCENCLSGEIPQSTVQSHKSAGEQATRLMVTRISWIKVTKDAANISLSELWRKPSRPSKYGPAEERGLKKW